METENFSYTEAATVDIWTDFIESYRESGHLEFYYMDKLVNMRAENVKVFRLDYDHLTDYNATTLHNNLVHLRFLTHHEPDAAKRTLRVAALNKLKDIQPDYYQEIERDFHVEFENAHFEKEIPELNVSDCGKLLKVTGIMTTRDEVSSAKTHYIAWRCEFGHLSKTQGKTMPTKCKGALIVTSVEGDDDNKEGETKAYEGCDSLRFTKDDKNSYHEDYLRFDIQQRSEKAVEARTPASIQVEVIGTDNVEWARTNLAFSQNISVTCIPRTRFGRALSGQGSVLSDIYLEASTIEILPEHYFEQVDPALDKIIQDTIRHDTDPAENLRLEKEGREKLVDSICPSMYMSNKLLKLLMLWWLVGSDPVVSPDGTRYRGEGQFFFLGDPGLGKSMIAYYVRRVRPRVVYNSSGKSSSVGLVGGLIYDKDGVARISPGAFGLAKNGCVILDEFSGRKQEDYDNLLEPLSDQQTVTISKGGEYRETRVNTAVLAIANPSTNSRYWNPNKNLWENTKIPPNILQRMDVTLIMRDTADPTEDAAKAKYFFENMKKAVAEEDFYKERPDKFKRRKENYYSIEYMKRWVAWVRQEFHPRVTDSPEAYQVIMDWYTRSRQMLISISEDGKEENEAAAPAGDMRKLGSCMRLAQMCARANQRNYVTKEDAEEVCQIMNMTLAEAGWWRMGADGSKQYEKDSLTAYREKKQGQWEEYWRAIFAKQLERISFERCYQCRGEGERIEMRGEGMELCKNCDAQGMIPIKFSRISLLTECVGTGQGRMTQKSFNTIWQEWISASKIVPADDYDDSFRNLMPYTGAAPKSNQTRSAKDRLKEKAMRDHPGVWKRFVKDSK